MALLTPVDVLRRMASLAGILLLIALALTLLWQVYVHHRQAGPYDREDSVTVETAAPGKICGRVALNYSPDGTMNAGTPDAISRLQEIAIT